MSDENLKKLKFAWIENPDRVGERLFTFDGEKVFNLFRDYPHALSSEEKELFDVCNPYWVEFFEDRK